MKCLKCHTGELQAGTTSLTYKRKGSLIQVEADGIPAEICSVCGEAYLSEAIAQQIFEIVNPLLSMEQEKWEQEILPVPTVDIHFPPLEPVYFAKPLVA